MFAVVVNHNGAAHLPACLEALATGPARPEILVVDNASTDGSPERAASTFAGITLLRNPRNRLFCQAANQGIELAYNRGAQFILVINADVFLEPGCLAAMVAFLRETADSGACQPLLVQADQPGRIQSAGCRVCLTGRAFDAMQGQPVAAAGQAPRPILGISGAAMLLTRRALVRAGPFCPSFGMYYEDVELSLRLRSLGFALYCLPTAVARHVAGGSARAYPVWRKVFRCERNALYLAWRHFPLPHLLAALLLGPTSALAAGLFHLFRRCPALAAAYLAGTLCGLIAGPFHLAVRYRLARAGSRSDRWRGLLDTAVIFPPCRPDAAKGSGPQTSKAL